MGLDFLGPIILFTCLNNVFGVSVPCGETYLAKNGHQCYPCSAGYYIVSDCVIDGEQSRCKPCGNWEYLPKCDNSTQCKKCDLFCHGGQIEIKACTPTSNLQCQCKDGYYWKPDPDRICTKHRKCNPGEGLKTKGTPYDDTICEPCKNGTSYSNLTSYNECTPCSVCNITQRSCNNIHDAVCGGKPGGTTNTPEAATYKSLVIALGVVGGVIFVVVVVVFLCIRHRHNTCNGRVQTSSNISNGRVNIPPDSQSTKNSDKRSPDVTGRQQNGLNCLRDVRNDTNNMPTSSNELRDEGVSKNSKELEGNQSLKNHDKDDECCIDMTGNNVAYSSGSKAADPSVQKGSLNGQANEEWSTGRITANEMNKNFEEKKFEPDSKTDKPDSTEQISLNNGSNISKNEAHDVNEIGAINNDYSKANGTLSHTSIDAAGVPSRHVQPETSSLQSSRDNRRETKFYATDHINTVETGCIPLLGAVTSVQSDGNGQSDNGNGTVLSDKRCYEVFTFMSQHLKWNTFLKFYRRLIADTDSKALSYVEPDIENTRQEWQSVEETIYRLMNNWKQRNPNGTMQSIVEALDKCGEKLMSEKLTSFINNLTKTDKVNGALKSDIVPNVGERHARGELSTSAQTVDNGGIV